MIKTINSTKENSDILIEYTGTYDTVDVSEVDTIEGTVASITYIIESDKFVGISSQNLILLDSTTDTDINYFTDKGLTVL